MNNFRFFNNINDFYVKVRPYEPLFRDPWWVFTCLVLYYVVSRVYGTGAFELTKRSPRFGILMCAICLSLIFTAIDIAASIHNFIGSVDGINPWWKLSLVFKCLTDTIMLDDFKTELKRLGIKRVQKDELRRQSFALVVEPHDSKEEEDDDHIEFRDVLNTNPARFQTTQNLSPSSSPMGRLRQDSVSNAQTESKETIGKAGKKISRLPGLNQFSLTPGKRKVKSEDTEKNSQNEEPRPTPPDRLSQMRQSLGF